MLKKLFIIMLSAAFVLVDSPVVSNTAAAAVAAPSAAGGEESIEVSDFSPGADLNLYLTNGLLQASEPAVAGPSYTFVNVEPNPLGYYVTQSVGGSESVNSNFVSASLRTPTATAGVGYIDAGNIFTGAAVTLYDLGGLPVSSTPVDQGDGTYRFGGLTARTVYYIVQSVNGVQSDGSGLATVLPAVPDAPTAANGEESIGVSGFTSGATLNLYLTNGTPQASESAVAGPVYTFENVEPHPLGYYVTQSVGGEESVNSNFVAASLRTPTAAAGVGYVDAGNIYPGATITLFDLGGLPVSDTPADQGDGTYRFGGLTARSTYYVVQSINGVNSNASSSETVQPAVPDAPSAANGEESIGVSGFTPGATLHLYLTNGTLKDTVPAVAGPAYTFENVEPHPLGYYVTQSIGGEESLNSNFVAAGLRTPTASAGIGYVDAGNIYPGATITLYDLGGLPVSDTPVDQGDGTYRFGGLTARTAYYVIQSINGVHSDNSSFETVQPAVPDAPTAANGEESIGVSGFTAGATLRLYLTNGTLTATEPAVSGPAYTFENVEPDSMGYYVTQTVAGEESLNSNFAAAGLRTPTASAGVSYVDAGNIYPGATISLYDLGGLPVLATPVDQGDGTYRFGGLPPRATYYVIQSINGVHSDNSSFVTVQAAVPDAPVVTDAEESIGVSGFTAGATLQLYLTNGTLKAAEPSVTASTYTFSNVEPNSLGYYVTQTVNGEESVNSSFVNARLRIPVAAAHINYVDVSNIYPGALVLLYDYTGREVSDSPADLGNGTVRFDGLTATQSYYAVQSINGVISEPTKIVTVLSLPAPADVTAAAGNRQVALNWSSVTGATYYNIYMDSRGEELSRIITTDTADTSYTITGLVNGTAYTFAVRAGNAGGIGAASSEVTAAPATVPGAPTGITAAAGDGQAVVTFTPPADNGGSAITGYTVTASPGNITVAGAGSPITVTGLMNGTGYTFTVTAINAWGSSDPSAESGVVVPAATYQYEGGGTAQPAGTSVNVLINGRAESAGTLITSSRNEQTVATIILDTDKLQSRLAVEGQNAVISIPVSSEADVVIAELTGQMIQDMEEKQATLVLQTIKGSYTLPAQQIRIASLASQFGNSAALQDIKLQIEIAGPAASMVQVVRNAAAQGAFTLVAPPVDFAVRALYGGTTAEVSVFSAYVERTLALPEGIDPNQITTGIVVEPDGNVRHVPTAILLAGGKYYAKVNSLTNSTYAIIWHPLEFRDAANHWANHAVNDMGSRMVIEGTGGNMFGPDRDITRAEFVAVLVRGLGIGPASGQSAFSDVNSAAWYNGFLQTAYAYELINGFEDGTFRPNDRITREQAMVIIAKAMILTDLQSKLAIQSADDTLRPYTDGAEVSAWARSGLASSVQSGIVTGSSSTELAPSAYISRAEVATIVQRLLQKSGLI